MQHVQEAVLRPVLQQLPEHDAAQAVELVLDVMRNAANKIAVALANARTDAKGAFKVTFKAPKDFGGLHDIFALVNGVQVTPVSFTKTTQGGASMRHPGRREDIVGNTGPGCEGWLP